MPGQFICGTHPKLREADELTIRARRLEREAKEEQYEHRELLKPEYAYKTKVHTAKGNDPFCNLPEGKEFITILGTLTNKNIFDEHMEMFGSISNAPTEVTHSVNYYRIEKILCRSGGGYIILKDQQHCSDEDWEMIKTGNIPKKFLK